MGHNETPEQQRERLRQQELKNNPIGNLNDSFNRAQNGGLDVGWKATGILILVILFGFIIYSIIVL